MPHQLSDDIDQLTQFKRKNNSQPPSPISINQNTHKSDQTEKEQSLKLRLCICMVLFLLSAVNIAWVVRSSLQVEGSLEELEELEDVKGLISSDALLENYTPSDFYWFSVSTRNLILNSNLDNMYKRSRRPYNMTRDVHLRAILFTQLIHNVDFHGNIKVELSPFQNDAKKKQEVIKRVMQMEESYYEEKYQVKKYAGMQVRFCIVIPSYNNVGSKLYLRNLDSIFMQDYENYHVVYVDDRSPDKTGEFVRKYVQEKEIPDEKIKIIINEVNKKAMQNIYEKIHEECPDGEIVGLIDGDDSFNGRQVLKLYNALFHQKKAALIYSNFLKIMQNNRTQYGFGNQALPQYFPPTTLPSSSHRRIPILATHFVAFYSQLFKLIKKSDFCYQNGTFFDYAYDKAILTPLMQMAHERSYYCPEMVYEYRNDTGMNDAGDQWDRVAGLIDARGRYEGVKDWGFVDQSEIILQGENNRENEKEKERNREGETEIK